MPSSFAEQIMPSLFFPYVNRAEMAKFPGRTAPGNATTTKSLTLKFLAPQIINLVFFSPTSKPTYLIGFLTSGNSSIERTFPTKSGPFKSLPCSSIPSTSKPTFTNACAITSEVIFAGKDTYSDNQLNGTFIFYQPQSFG